jgi:pimeloyl-ACP methyl ester carboxylesterase
MRNVLEALGLIFILAAFPLAAEGDGIYPGRFEGELNLADGPSPMVLRLLEGGGGLIDLPGQDIYGYPLSRLAVSEDSIRFSVGFPGDSGGRLDFELKRTLSLGKTSAIRLVGSYTGSGGSGRAWLAPTRDAPTAGIPLPIEVKGGQLRGKLLLPKGWGPYPLVIIVPGSGTTDMDGNNYAVPGKSDAYLQLALALREAGVASFRFDKRGAGESYALAGPESDSRFDDFIEDAEAVVYLFLEDRRFSRITVLGHAEGGLVAASALNRLGAGDAILEARVREVSLILLCSTGRKAVDLVEASLAEAGPDKAAEAASIMEALKAGATVPAPSDFFADFFRPSFQPYLISWFKTDLVAELKSRKGSLHMVQGRRDLQVSLAEFALLAAARPDSPAIVLPGMNHVLKQVGGDPEENYRAFSDPAFPLAESLVGLLAAWAKDEPLPPGLARFDGGRPEPNPQDKREESKP